ncbi:unnamed protein product [Nippostrongylus brasiliensis]|uniref:Uncharacterized protein n=1 Tax=Nippostrongylus brasiliensis TaxID=27835 RepID=A0A0N4XGT3_NIPBR|nr:unnamed protein product [Nippostrongylus brasiliensis]
MEHFNPPRVVPFFESSQFLKDQINTSCTERRFLLIEHWERSPAKDGKAEMNLAWGPGQSSLGVDLLIRAEAIAKAPLATLMEFDGVAVICFPAPAEVFIL